MDRLPLPGAYIYMVKHEKMYIKSDFKAIFFKPATNGQSDMGFLLTSTFITKGLSAPALLIWPYPGAIYMYKSFKIYTRSSYQVRVYRITSPLVYPYD